MATPARRHHTVPKFYLDGFASDGHLTTVQLPGERRFTQSTNNAALRTQFYTIPELEEPDAFEKGLSAMETEAAAIMRRIVVDRRWPLDPESRSRFAVFLAIQLLRGPDQRRQMEQIAALATQLEVGLGGRERVPAWVKHNKGFEPTPEQADQIWQDVTRPGGPPIKLSAAGHIEQLGQMLPEILPYFTGRPWALIRFERRALLTCDTPVTILPSPQDPDGAVGLLSSPGINFPLSRRVGLMLANPEPLIDRVSVEQVRQGHADIQLPPTTSYARIFNTWTIANTREWIFHHPDDADLVPPDLPQPSKIEISAEGLPEAM